MIFREKVPIEGFFRHRIKKVTKGNCDLSHNLDFYSELWDMTKEFLTIETFYISQLWFYLFFLRNMTASCSSVFSSSTELQIANYNILSKKK